MSAGGLVRASHQCVGNSAETRRCSLRRQIRTLIAENLTPFPANAAGMRSMIMAEQGTLLYLEYPYPTAHSTDLIIHFPPERTFHKSNPRSGVLSRGTGGLILPLLHSSHQAICGILRPAPLVPVIARGARDQRAAKGGGFYQCKADGMIKVLYPEQPRQHRVRPVHTSVRGVIPIRDSNG